MSERFTHPPEERGLTLGEKRDKNKITQKKCDLVDSEGNILCQSLYEIQEVEAGESWNGGTQLLTSFYIINGDKKIDILKLVDIKKPKKIFVAQDQSRSYNFHFTTGNLVVPEPNSPIAVSIILHELGHAKQSEDEQYIPFFLMKETKAFEEEAVRKNPQKYLMEASYRLKDYPELERVFPSEEDTGKLQLAAASTQEKKYQLDEKRRKFSELDDEDENECTENGKQDNYNEHSASQEIDNLWREIKKLEDEIFDSNQAFDDLFKPFKRIIHLHRKILEKDATRRAFQWFRIIYNDTNADIVGAKINFSPKDFKDSNFVTQDEKERLLRNAVNMMKREGGFSAKIDLLSKLDGYEALGNSPMPKRKSTKNKGGV